MQSERKEIEYGKINCGPEQCSQLFWKYLSGSSLVLNKILFKSLRESEMKMNKIVADMTPEGRFIWV